MTFFSHLQLAAALAAFASAAYAAPPVWVIESEGASVHMIGTAHVLEGGEDWRSPALDRAMDSADVLWLEIADPASPPAGLGALVAGLAAADEPLSALLGQDDGAELGRILAGHGLPSEAFDELRPWAAYLQLYGLAIQDAGLTADSGIDMKLRAYAVERGMAIRGFEDFTTQITTLAEMSEDDAVAALRHLIAEHDHVMRDFKEQIAGWLRGDLSAADDATTRVKDETPGLYEAMFASRNVAFADGIEDILSGDQDAVVAIGLGHFVGPGSVLDLLKARGHEVVTR